VITAPLPDGIAGHFGPQLRRFVLTQYHQGQTTVHRLPGVEVATSPQRQRVFPEERRLAVKTKIAQNPHRPRLVLAKGAYFRAKSPQTDKLSLYINHLLLPATMEICGRGGRMLAARVEQKNGMTRKTKMA
jgi:hypothetical protein